MICKDKMNSSHRECSGGGLLLNSMLEQVQRRWTKKINGFVHYSYSDRLCRLNLYSVKGRLLGADLIQVWKITGESVLI